jgi:hypothetical protein
VDGARPRGLLRGPDRTSEQPGHARTKKAKQLIKFPRQSKIVRFDKVTGAVKTHLKSQFSFRRINRKKDLTWRGPSLSRFLAAGCLPYGDHFKAGNLRYSEQEQGRDAMTEILGTVVQVGMEQGRRLVASGTRLKQAERHLRRAKRFTTAGKIKAAGKAVQQAQAVMPTLPKHVRTGRKRHADHAHLAAFGRGRIVSRIGEYPFLHRCNPRALTPVSRNPPGDQEVPNPVVESR